VAKLVLERNATDPEFVAQATEGFEAYAEQVRGTSWEEIEQNSGVDRATIARITDFYIAAKHVVFGWTMGITHHAHGVGNVQSIVNLALLRGMVGRPHTGLMPIRGHSNVQGIGSVGVVPNLKQAIFDNLEKHLGVPLPRAPGLDTLACIQAADRGEMRSAICLGGNLFGSNPDSRLAQRALGKLQLVTYLNTTLNTGHAWGRGQETLILPAKARDEEAEPTTQESMFNFVRLSDGGAARLQGPRGEVEVLAAIGRGVLGDVGPVNWQSLKRHCNIRQLIAQIIPGMDQIGAIDKTRAEFHIAGRILHERRFPTASGKARFSVHPLPTLHGNVHELRLMTVRSEGQFNTVVYEEEDIYRGQERRDVILLNRADIDRLGLRINQRVTVRNQTGVMPNIVVREYDIRAGNALMYYPEANVLVPATVDPQSKTPAFKSVLITIEAGPSLVANGQKTAHAERLPLEVIGPTR
jgi:molybdopterin-dependent oxidoreductase alpha subunit